MHRTWETITGQFDIITYHDVIEHVVDPFAELVSVQPFLRPCGMLVIDTPDADDPRFAGLGLSRHHMKPQDHLWFFTERHLRWLAERAGLAVDRVDRPIPARSFSTGAGNREPTVPRQNLCAAAS